MLNDIPGYFVRGREDWSSLSPPPFSRMCPCYWQEGTEVAHTQLSPKTQSGEFCLKFCIICTHLHGEIFSKCIWIDTLTHPHPLSLNPLDYQRCSIPTFQALLFKQQHVWILLVESLLVHKSFDIIAFLSLNCQQRLHSHHVYWVERNWFSGLDI